MAILSDELNAVCIQTLDDMWLQAFVRQHPFLDRLKLKQANGNAYKIPVQTGAGGGQSTNFGNSLTNSAANGFTAEGFIVPPACVFGNERIQWTDAALSMGPASPVEIPLNATKNALLGATENLANMLLGASSGAAGAYATITTATNTTGNIWRLLLSNVTDAAKFAEGQVIVQKATAGAALSSGTGTVTGVNQVGGSILVDVGSTGMTPTNGYIIGLQGQLPSGTSTTDLYASVLQWIPPYSARTSGVPTTTTFLGVDRSEASNVAMVSGWAFNGTALPVFQAVYQAAAYMKNASKSAETNEIFVNPLILSKMAAECQQEMRYDMKSVNGVDVGFAGFETVLPTGKATVLGEPSMPTNQILMSKKGSWEFAKPASGKIFQPATGNEMIIPDFGAGTGLNQSRASVMALGYFGCNEPSSNCIVTVGVPTGLAVS